MKKVALLLSYFDYASMQFGCFGLVSLSKVCLCCLVCALGVSSVATDLFPHPSIFVFQWLSGCFIQFSSVNELIFIVCC